MQKNVSFFERHVQWFAVGLGGLFLAFMVYSYVLSSPIKVTAGGKELSPGEVDQATLDGPIVELRRDIANPVVPEIKHVDYITQFLATIGGAQNYPQLAVTTFAAPTMDGKIGNFGGPSRNISERPVAVLPVLPVAKPVMHNHGRSSVMLPDPNFKPNPKKPDAQPKLVERDKDWWSGSWTISSAQLAKSFATAFDAAKIEKAGLKPEAFMQTAFIDVEVVREERQADGTFGKQVVVKPLSISTREPFPGEKADEEAVAEYLDWVTGNRDELLEPAFYEVAAGDEWEAPVQVVGEEVAPEERERIRKQNLARIKEREERKRAQSKEARARKAEENRARRASGAGGGGAGGGMRMPPGMGQAPNMPGTPYGGGGRGMPPGMGQGQPNGGMVDPYGAGMPGAGAGMGQGGAGGVGAGNGWINVGDLADDIVVIAHDDAVQPGKTYRYRLRYRILNPVYKAFQAAPEDLTKRFAITSDYSAYTRPVTIRPQVEFFLAQLRGGKAVFDVFQWRDGKWQKRSVEAIPGDAIGATGFAVVDVRATGRKPYSLVMDRTGGVDRHVPEGANPSPRYQTLLKEVGEGETEVGMTR